MSHFNLENLRSVSTDPNQRNINELAKKLAKFLSKDIEVNLDDEEDLIANGVQVDDGLKFNDTFYHREQYDDQERTWYPLGDIDGGNLSVLLRGDHLGSQLLDRSQFYSNNANLYGDPKLVDGSLDTGVLGGTYKSLALRFNRPTSPDDGSEYMSIPDTTDLTVNGIATGFSVIMRIRPFSFADQGVGSLQRTLYRKVDDDSPNDGTMLQINNSGRLIATVRRASTNYRVIAPALSAMTTSTVHEIAITYAVSGNDLKIYLDGVDTSATNDPSSPNWGGVTTDHNFLIFTRNKAGGFVYGDFYILKYWKEKVLSAAQILDHYTNKWSISDHLLGEIAVVNHCTPYVENVSSFTAASFTSTSFMTP